ncbi:hypothetical protein FPY71_03515 [Aureimonas fodinaquatilis]|uniref:DUF2946 domain-containing protein n=1 Tax=Aureimonas fodinaquatilis TaxID=2565783 RepID=A0A5B0DZG9_9HYPH|nr:hypothetical protein [Aureimonas fodinaquatilis]KAA0972194.1 hypothetical protein FPY71_03515 [Aureimonas fodinaquatilis]
MLNSRGNVHRLWVALVVAYMLVLQSVAGAWAHGVGPDSSRLDAFGNPLCITSTDQHTGSSDQPHSNLPNCCTLGCGMFVQALAATGNSGSVQAFEPFPRLIAFPARSEASTPQPDYNPGSPRAPPFSV